MDEGLREKADILSIRVQEELVKLANMRRNLPQQIDTLNSETLRIHTSATENAEFVLNPQDGSRSFLT